MWYGVIDGAAHLSISIPKLSLDDRHPNPFHTQWQMVWTPVRCTSCKGPPVRGSCSLMS